LPTTKFNIFHFRCVYYKTIISSENSAWYECQ